MVMDTIKVLLLEHLNIRRGRGTNLGHPTSPYLIV